MATVYSIRGTNGSGKTTLARYFLPPNLFGDERGGPVDLNHYPSPTKRDPDRQLRAQGYVRQPNNGYGRIGILGLYTTACGGMDRMPSFEVCQGGIDYMIDPAGPLHCDFVIAEGLLASGTYGSWGRYSAALRERGHAFAFCYLQTPLEICKERVRTRQAAKGSTREINWQLVTDKYNNVITNRTIALNAGELVYDLPYGSEKDALKAIMLGRGDQYRG